MNINCTVVNVCLSKIHSINILRPTYLTILITTLTHVEDLLINNNMTIFSFRSISRFSNSKCIYFYTSSILYITINNIKIDISFRSFTSYPRLFYLSNSKFSRSRIISRSNSKSKPLSQLLREVALKWIFHSIPELSISHTWSSTNSTKLLIYMIICLTKCLRNVNTKNIILTCFKSTCKTYSNRLKLKLHVICLSSLSIHNVVYLNKVTTHYSLICTNIVEVHLSLSSVRLYCDCTSCISLSYTCFLCISYIHLAILIGWKNTHFFNTV